MRTAPAITVVNQHTNNYGDDAAGMALVRACLEDLQAEKVDVFYIWDRGVGGLPTQDPRVRHHTLPILSGTSDNRPALAKSAALQAVFRKLPHPALRHLLETANKSDFVLVSPAGSNIGIYKDWMYLLVLLSLVLSGIRPIFFQNTIGPSNSRVFNAVSKFVLRRSEIYVREAASQAWLASIGQSAYLGVDTALLHEETVVPITARERVIAVVPTGLASWHRDFRGSDEGTTWRDALADVLARFSASSGLAVRIVPHLYGPQAEPAELEALVSALSARGCNASIADVIDLNGYTSELSTASVVVSMRYHGLILSAMSGTPCVSLAYENKMREAANYLGQAELASDVSNFDPENLLRQLELAVAHASEFGAATTRAVEAVRPIARGPLLSMRAHLEREVVSALNIEENA